MKPQYKQWIERDGVIFLDVITPGLSGREWRRYFREQGIFVSKEMKQTLWPDNVLKSTQGVERHIAIIKGRFFSKKDLKTQQILAEGKRRGWGPISLEDVCLMRRVLTKADFIAMGLKTIVGMWALTLEETNQYDFLLSRVFFQAAYGRLLFPVISESRSGAWLSLFAGGKYNTTPGKWDQNQGFAFSVSCQIVPRQNKLSEHQ